MNESCSQLCIGTIGKVRDQSSVKIGWPPARASFQFGSAEDCKGMGSGNQSQMDCGQGIEGQASETKNPAGVLQSALFDS